MKNSYFFKFLLVFLGVQVCLSQSHPKFSRDSLASILEKIDSNIDTYNYQQAIDDSHLLIELAKDNESPYFLSRAYNSLGHVYIDLKDDARALKNYRLGLEYAHKSENDTLLLRSYNYLGNVYSEDPKSVKKGIDYYNQVIELAEKINDPIEAVIPNTNIGWTYLDLGNYEKAFPYIKRSLEVLESEGETYEGERVLTELYSYLYKLHGRYYTHKENYDLAEEYFEKSIQIAEEDSILIAAAEAYRYYAEMLKAKGDYQKALYAQEKYTDYNASIFEKEKLKEMEIANARFNLNEYRKNLEIAEKEKKYQEEIIAKSKEKVVIMVLSSLGLIFILVFLHKVNRDRQSLIQKLKTKNTQFKEAKEEAERLSILKTRFFSTVSHEIRTPLYGVIGITSLLLEDKELSKHKNDLQSLKFSADYLLALINDVLQMNKMESNEVKLENASFNLENLMHSIVNSFEFTRLQNKNDIRVNIDKEIPAYLIGDSVRLSQILMNLVGNAMKFTERGEIQISVKQEKITNKTSQLYFQVRDNGPGIPESKKKVIFEEFSQLENSNYNYQGTGLGLPIVKGLLKLFGSKIHLDSKEGVGSTFSFRIKFEIDTARTQEEKVKEEIFSIETGSKKILVVDDNRINQVVTNRILTKKDMECEVASNGQEAIDLAKKENFDLILMDVNMPGISGLEASRRIREFNSEIPILALTAVEVEEIREEIQKAGMNGIIVKPYDVQQFYQIIFKHLSLKDQPEEV